MNVSLGASSLFVNQTTQATATLRDANNLQKGIAPLGAWRTLGLGDYSRIIESQPSYSVAAVVPNTVNAYIPSGLWGQLAFFNPLAPAPRPSTWDLYFRIVASVP